ncbi:unnamed protein product [Didymodactylos carnosus]|uniref:Uncharacterized protein n=1 Tax=Didymodactylos carnosus TaxID=1234261 RepID=A0A814LUN5_9BILA|nr:unnamed protein product [Didymodactylos carnosus]CAF1070349.1 unnamed protein product [Didymodactylos carnosus]CAF3648089.1 unnamed protein product [Didymodactylos carnosus]CAF3837534.1 unnamed protein product [Didymodactylos carnosus]
MNTELNCCRTVSLINETIDMWPEEKFADLVRRCSTIGTDQNCSHSSLFHCPLSLKCISKHRLVDGWNDCYFGEDELFPACQLNDSWRFICESEPNKCLSRIALRNGDQNCRNGEDELTKNQRNTLKGNIPFELFCDGQNDLLWMDMLNETDETHCEWWPCNTPNVQCDNVWHCLNGADELNCPGIQCLSNEHRCQIGFSNEYICVPILHLMETYSNCETSFFRQIYLNNVIFNDSMNYFLWNQTKCIMSKHVLRFYGIKSTAVFIHCITAFENSKHQRTTILKKIEYDENIITLLVTQPFHILIAELFNQNYYLIVLREKFIESEHIQTKLTSKQRCVFIHELLNTTFRSYSPFNRIKYYPLLCRQHQQLVCLYDENYMCICDLDRFSNCFTFDHSITYDCHGYSDCKNGGQCFQDNFTCSTVSVCVCSDCYYGTKCHISTRGFVLSLDCILGYHIKPNVSFFRQPLIVQMSVASTTVMLIFGSINGILSISTFRMKKATDVARSRVTVRTRLSFKEHLQLQFKQHKHHLIASCTLALLALPRLIKSFIGECMKSPRNSWLFLLGYLISFLPSMVTFIVFVLPSKIYKDEFNSVINRLIRRLSTHVNY